MVNEPRGLNKRRVSNFRVGVWVQQETPKEGRRTYWPKCCEYNNKDDNNPKTQHGKNHLKTTEIFFWRWPQVGFTFFA